MSGPDVSGGRVASAINRAALLLSLALLAAIAALWLWGRPRAHGIPRWPEAGIVALTNGVAPLQEGGIVAPMPGAAPGRECWIVAVNPGCSHCRDRLATLASALATRMTAARARGAARGRARAARTPCRLRALRRRACGGIPRRVWRAPLAARRVRRGAGVRQRWPPAADPAAGFLRRPHRALNATPLRPRTRPLSCPHDRHRVRRAARCRRIARRGDRRAPLRRRGTAEPAARRGPGRLRTLARRALAPEERERFAVWLARRLAGEPVQYITGRAAFRDLDLAVDRRVLIPRPETEGLVEAVLEALAASRERWPRPAVLDLGTGSGAIALAIAHEWPAAAVTATDASAGALEVARANAAALGLAERVTFAQRRLVRRRGRRRALRGRRLESAVHRALGGRRRCPPTCANGSRPARSLPRPRVWPTCARSWTTRRATWWRAGCWRSSCRNRMRTRWPPGSRAPTTGPRRAARRPRRPAPRAARAPRARPRDRPGPVGRGALKIRPPRGPGAAFRPPRAAGLTGRQAGKMLRTSYRASDVRCCQGNGVIASV